MDRIQSLPNVAAAYLRPLRYGSIGMDAPVVLEGQPFHSPAARSNPLVNWEVVTPHYFAALGITLKAGRSVTFADRADSEPVVILGESAARRLWSNDNAIGKRLLTIDGPVDPQGQPRWQRIVGIVGDVRYREITGTRLDVYLLDTQSETPAKCFVVRTQGDPLLTLGAVRAIVRNLDPQQPIDAATTMGDMVAEVQQRRPRCLSRRLSPATSRPACGVRGSGQGAAGRVEGVTPHGNTGAIVRPAS